MTDGIVDQLRRAFEANMDRRIARAQRIRVHNIVPDHWFTAAASECAQATIDGHFYGAISVAQAYVEVLSSFLVERHKLRSEKEAVRRWDRLEKENVITYHAKRAAIEVLNERNDFHHLNKNIERDLLCLEERSIKCLDNIYQIESEIFSYDVKKGEITPRNLIYWDMSSKNGVRVFIRNIP